MYKLSEKNIRCSRDSFLHPLPLFIETLFVRYFQIFFFFFHSRYIYPSQVWSGFLVFGVFRNRGIITLKLVEIFFFSSCFALLPQTKVARFNQNFVVPALAISYLALNIHKLKFVTRRKEGFYVSPLCRGVTPKIEIQWYVSGERYGKFLPGY